MNNLDRIADVAVIGAIIAVIVLKIIGIITIPWVWLLSPIWICFGLGIIIALAMMIIFFIQCKKEKRK